MLSLVERTASQWGKHNGWIFAGAMTAFAGLAIAPLVLIVVRVAQTFGHEHRLLAALGTALGLVIGATQAHSVNATVRASNAADRGALPVAAAALMAIFAGSRFVFAMQTALQRMWSINRGDRPTVWTTLRDLLVSGITATVVMAALLGLLIGGSLLFSAGRAAPATVLGVPLVRTGIALGAAVVLVPLFAALFKWLPRTPIAWSDVWVGATVTAIFFATGQIVIGAYLAVRHVQTMYGSASAIVVLLLWLYYSSYTFLLGAEFTQVYARSVGSLFHNDADTP